IAGPKPERAREIYAEPEKGYEKVGHPELAAKAREMGSRVRVPPAGAPQPGSKTRSPPPEDEE
ncbi:MAG TPA: hypothetical protein VG755_33195, partial [Nannocystaceae bacterium]|nr:hypothetical protein [Nannocystaceae bacterium]